MRLVRAWGGDALSLPPGVDVVALTRDASRAWALGNVDGHGVLVAVDVARRERLWTRALPRLVTDARGHAVVSRVLEGDRVLVAIEVEAVTSVGELSLVDGALRTFAALDARPQSLDRADDDREGLVIDGGLRVDVRGGVASNDRSVFRASRDGAYVVLRERMLRDGGARDRLALRHLVSGRIDDLGFGGAASDALVAPDGDRVWCVVADAPQPWAMTGEVVECRTLRGLRRRLTDASRAGWSVAAVQHAGVEALCVDAAGDPDGRALRAAAQRNLAEGDRWEPTASNVSPDGARVGWVAVGGLRVLDLTTGERLEGTGRAVSVTAVASAPDGTVASAFADGSLAVWSASDDDPRWRFEATRVDAVALSPDARSLYALDRGDDALTRLRVWDLVAGTERTPDELAFVAATALALSPDGSRAVVTGGARQGPLFEWIDLDAWRARPIDVMAWTGALRWPVEGRPTPRSARFADDGVTASLEAESPRRRSAVTLDARLGVPITRGGAAAWRGPEVLLVRGSAVLRDASGAERLVRPGEAAVTAATLVGDRLVVGAEDGTVWSYAVESEAPQ